MNGNAPSKTIIADDIEIVGSVKSANDIELSCKLNGDLNCGGNAVIGQSAAIKGNISATSTTIQGQINGNVSVKDRIELKATARINGDVRAKRLTVEDGATFIGKCEVNPTGTAAAARSGAESKSEGESEEAAETETSGEGKSGKGGVFGRK